MQVLDSLMSRPGRQDHVVCALPCTVSRWRPGSLYDLSLGDHIHLRHAVSLSTWDMITVWSMRTYPWHGQ